MGLEGANKSNIIGPQSSNAPHPSMEGLSLRETHFKNRIEQVIDQSCIPGQFVSQLISDLQSPSREGTTARRILAEHMQHKEQQYLSIARQQGADSVTTLQSLEYHDTTFLPVLAPQLDEKERLSWSKYMVSHLGQLANKESWSPEDYRLLNHVSTMCYYLKAGALIESTTEPHFESAFADTTCNILSRLTSLATNLENYPAVSRSASNFLTLSLPWRTLGCKDYLKQLFESIDLHIRVCSDREPSARSFLDYQKPQFDEGTFLQDLRYAGSDTGLVDDWRDDSASEMPFRDSSSLIDDTALASIQVLESDILRVLCLVTDSNDSEYWNELVYKTSCERSSWTLMAIGLAFADQGKFKQMLGDLIPAASRNYGAACRVIEMLIREHLGSSHEAGCTFSFSLFDSLSTQTRAQGREIAIAFTDRLLSHASHAVPDFFIKERIVGGSHDLKHREACEVVTKLTDQILHHPDLLE